MALVDLVYVHTASGRNSEEICMRIEPRTRLHYGGDYDAVYALNIQAVLVAPPNKPLWRQPARRQLNLATQRRGETSQ